MSQGGQVAVKADEDVVAVSRARELEQRVRELERLLGCVSACNWGPPDPVIGA
jgi:hypothetical protein